ncbi:hypothetical protein PsYK624_089620 [Phanerochaete sordida]|uniref:Uncharacterized protein n=1 Tax=Phanerochaete sordida TaxID=48140 RepID=A0A9P3GFI3_9APHY|nr:hypothetical protein PsYK624_089620 [Phanerochaete sordida]
MCWLIIQREKSLPRMLGWLAAVLTMYIFATIHAAIAMNFLLSNFINAADSPGVISAFSHRPRWYNATGIAALLAVLFVADCVYIWRCWVVWGKRWIVIAPPLMCLIAGNTLSIIGGVAQTDAQAGPEKTEPKLAHLSATYYVLELALTLYLTIFITGRIVMVQLQFPQASARRHFAVRYFRAVEIIVEGCALYTTLFLVNVVFAVRQDPRAAWTIALMPQLGGMIPTLLLLRVAMGMTRPDSSYNDFSVSSVVFRATRSGRTSGFTTETAAHSGFQPAGPITPAHGITSVILQTHGHDSSGTLTQQEKDGEGDEYPV